MTGARVRSPLARVDGSLETTNRGSDSAWIESVWTTEAKSETTLTTVASSTLGLVFSENDGSVRAHVTGAESTWGSVAIPRGSRYLGVQLRAGTLLTGVDSSRLVGGGIELNRPSSRRFVLQGRLREVPLIDDAEAFVERLAADGAITRDPVVDRALAGLPPQLHRRAVERRFRTTTGLTHGMIVQIERAREAARELMDGARVRDVVATWAYYDEAHLARLLRRFIGRSAGQLSRGLGGALALPGYRTTS